MSFLLQRATLAVSLVTFSAGIAHAQTRDFNIPALTSGEAIARFARQSGLQIVAPGGEIVSRLSQPVKGRWAPDVALRNLLKGTGLEIRKWDPPVVSLGRITKTTSEHEKAKNSQRREEAITVQGHRSAAASEMAASNDVSIADSTFIARHPDSNIAETLGRLPGVNVLSTTIGGSLGGSVAMIDNASRGEGQFISVRGIGPDYTLNLIDGVNVASAKPASRQIQLSLMPPLGFSQVKVSKTGQASDDGQWIAGFVDFHTPSAFEVRHDMFSIVGRADSNVQGYQYGLYRGPFNGGGVVQAEANKLFGPEHRFGVHSLAYYQSRNFASQVSNQNEGNWDFIRSLDGSDHTLVPGVTPTDNMVPEQINPQVSYGNSQRYGGNLALDWRGDHVSLFARGSYAYSDTMQATIQRGLQSTKQLQQQNADGTYTVQEASVVGSYYYTTNPEQQMLSTMQVGANFDCGWLNGTLKGFGSLASDDEDSVSLSYKNFLVDPSGTTLLLQPHYSGDPAFPIESLTAAQLAEMNNLADYTPQTNANWGFQGAQETVYKNSQSLGGVSAGFTAHTDLPYLPKIHFGAKYLATNRTADNRDYSYDGGDQSLPGLPQSLADNRFVTGSLSSPLLGGYGSLYPFSTPIMDQSAILSYLHGVPLSYASASYGGGWTSSARQEAYNANVNTQRAQEHVTSLYVSFPFKAGIFQATPGLRYEYSDIHNQFWNAGFADSGVVSSGGFVGNATHYSEFLPSLFLTARPNGWSVYRASFDTSYVRPNTFLLGGGKTITADGDNVFTIQQGNPALRPVVAHSFDVAGQWMLPNGSHFALAGFYKLLSDYLFDAGNSTRSDGTHYVNTNGTTQISPTLILITPHNGGAARAYGLEMSAEDRLTFLPAPFNGLSLSGNLTLQKTHANLGIDGIRNGTPIQYAPTWMFNVSLAYETARFNTNLSFHRVGRFLETYYTYSTATGPVDISWWDQPIQRLDYFAQMHVTRFVDVSFSAQNLMNDASYYATRGPHSVQIPQIVRPGRTFFLTAGVHF